MTHSSVGYCPCRAEIWIEYLPTDQGWQVRFFDSENHLIDTCPECHCLFEEEDLASR